MILDSYKKFMSQAALILVYSILSLLIISFDRVTKYFALYYLKAGKFLSNFIDLDFILNRGISFGIFNSDNSFIFCFITLLVFLITVYLLVYTVDRYKNGHKIFGEILVLSGSLSNIVDRLIYGGVIDFISIKYILPFTFFNIADVSICLGIFIMFLKFYKSEI